MSIRDLDFLLRPTSVAVIGASRRAYSVGATVMANLLAVKAGRMAERARAAASHTGALAGADEVYDAAIARAGMLRVDTIEDLFDAIETLARARPVGRIVKTNGRIAVEPEYWLKRLGSVS